MKTELNKIAPRAVADRELGMILAIAPIAASPERVFNALISDETETWWGAPEVYTIAGWQADLRVGGQWSLKVVQPDGNAVPAGGEFLEIEKPGKIVITRRYDFDYPILGRRVTKVTYLVDAYEDGTRLTVRHEGFGEAIQAAYDHADGWERYLGWLGDYFNEGA
jgi:uncharacterized protein YndB with AHSA1/START domain